MNQEQAQVALQQIGRMNVMAISGGRSTLTSEGNLNLPVSNGYHVEISLDLSDTYTVSRIFARGGKHAVKGQVANVFADELGETAYRASCFHDEWITEA